MRERGRTQTGRTFPRATTAAVTAWDTWACSTQQRAKVEGPPGPPAPSPTPLGGQLLCGVCGPLPAFPASLSITLCSAAPACPLCAFISPEARLLSPSVRQAQAPVSAPHQLSRPLPNQGAADGGPGLETTPCGAGHGSAEGRKKGPSQTCPRRTPRAHACFCSWGRVWPSQGGECPSTVPGLRAMGLLTTVGTCEAFSGGAVD